MIKRALIALIATTTLGIGAPHAAQEFRQRLSGVSADIATLSRDLQAEVEFGRNLASLILGRHPLKSSAEQQRYINLVGRSLAMHGERQEIDYHFAIIDSDQVNAYAAPGGYIFVTSSAIDMMQDEAELAGVLAHEIAHVNRRHIVRELNIRGEGGGIESGLAHLLGGVGDSGRIAFNQALEKAVELLFDSGLKKEDEYEADRMGTLLLTQTGYDPMALRRYLQRIKQSQGEKTAVLNNTHPGFGERLFQLDRLIDGERLATLNAPDLRQRFQQHTRSH